MKPRAWDLGRVALAFSGAAGLGASGCTEPPPELGQTRQAAYTLSTDEVLLGQVEVGGYGFGTVTVSPTNFVMNTINAVTFDCDAIELAHPATPFTVWRECADPALAGAPAAPPFCEFGEIDHTMTIDVTFHPLAVGSYSCFVNIDSPQGDQSFVISGSAIPIARDLALLSPLELPLGQVPTGTSSSPGTVTVRSIGSQAISLTAEVSGAGFALTSGNGATHTLAPNTNEAFDVTCSPDAVGSLAGTLTLTHNSLDPADTSPTVFALSCEGIDSNLTVSPSPVSFDATRVGERSTITLDLGAALAGTTVNFEGAAIAGSGLSIVEQPAAGTNISNAGGVALELAFEPTEDGDVSGVLTIDHDGESRQVSVLAPARVSTLSISPSGDLAFGPVCPGDAADLAVLIGNPGSADYTLDDVRVTGAGFAIDELAPPPEELPFVVEAAGGTSASLHVVATPAEGAQVGELTIDSDVPGAEHHVIALSATGMPAGVAATPSEVDFGEVLVGASSGVASVYLSNCVAGGLTIESATVTGADADEFLIVQSPASMSLGASEAAEWVLQLQPETAGAKEAVLEIVHAGGTERIDLRGTSALDADDIRGTYYACSASGGGAAGSAGLVALALLLAPTRRRRARR
jgi:hypothetical protein